MEPLWVQICQLVEGGERSACPAAPQVRGAELVEGILEVRRDLQCRSECIDGETGVAEGQLGDAEEVVGLRELLQLRGLLEVGDSLLVASADAAQGTEGEQWQKRVRCEQTSAVEHGLRFVPALQVGERRTEVDECLEVGTA